MIHLNRNVSSEHLILWMHGLGADSNDFVPFFSDHKFNKFEIVLPDAPIRKVTANQNMPMRAWFDMPNFKLNNLSEDDFIESRISIEKLIKEISFNKKKIFIGGFSQGAALGLYIGLTSKLNVNGIVCFSGFLPKFNYINNYLKIPLLKIHGSKDDVIPIEESNNSFKNLKFKKLQIKNYDMGHNVIDDQAHDLIKFMEDS